MKQLFDLSGRVAIVTGGSGGIGAATARLLAEHGADLVITGRNVVRLQAAAKSICAGRRVLTVTADMSREDEVIGLVDKTIAEYGHIDILVNNAGAPIQRGIENTTVAEWESVMGSNLLGAFVATREAGRHMLKTGGGAIVNISSIAGMNAVPAGVAYGAAKAALQNFTQATSTSWARRGVRANAIAVGVIAHAGRVRSSETVARFAAGTPLGRLGAPEEIASVVLFLVSDAASFVTGTTVLATGGMVDSAPFVI